MLRTKDIFGEMLHGKLMWRRNGCDGVSKQQPHDCLLNNLFRRRSKKTSKLRVTGLCARNSPVTGELSAQMASNADNVSIWWCHLMMSSQALPERFLHTGPVMWSFGVSFYGKVSYQRLEDHDSHVSSLWCGISWDTIKDAIAHFLKNCNSTNILFFFSTLSTSQIT